MTNATPHPPKRYVHDTMTSVCEECPSFSLLLPSHKPPAIAITDITIEIQIMLNFSLIKFTFSYYFFTTMNSYLSIKPVIASTNAHACTLVHSRILSTSPDLSEKYTEQY